MSYMIDSTTSGFRPLVPCWDTWLSDNQTKTYDVSQDTSGLDRDFQYFLINNNILSAYAYAIIARDYNGTFTVSSVQIYSLGNATATISAGTGSQISIKANGACRGMLFRLKNT